MAEGTAGKSGIAEDIGNEEGSVGRSRWVVEGPGTRRYLTGCVLILIGVPVAVASVVLMVVLTQVSSILSAHPSSSTHIILAVLGSTLALSLLLLACGCCLRRWARVTVTERRPTSSLV